MSVFDEYEAMEDRQIELASIIDEAIADLITQQQIDYPGKWWSHVTTGEWWIWNDKVKVERRWISDNDLCEYIFFTREELERKIKELEGKND